MGHNKSTAGGAIVKEVNPDKSGQLEMVRIHLDATSATSENLVVSIVSAAGNEYNIVCATQDMNTLTDYIWQPTRPHPFFRGDKIKVTWLNTNAVIYGLEIMWR